MQEFYTPDEVAAKLRVTRRTVYSWLTSGRLSGLRAGRGWRVPAESLEQFMRTGAGAGSVLERDAVGAADRAARVKALRGKYAYAHSTVDEFCLRKQEEIDRENSRWESQGQ